MKYFSNYVFLVAFLCFFSSCIKDEGEGGRSTIEGYVYLVVSHDDQYTLSPDGTYALNTDTFPAAKADVFITYGGDRYFGNDIKAGPDGFYQFKYLTKGNYKIFAYSTLASGERVAVEKEIKIGKGTSTVEDIYIHDGKANGTYMVKGAVNKKIFISDDRTFLPSELGGDSISAAGDTRVYIQRKGADFYVGDVRTSKDGVFIFQKLSPGDYTVYTYTNDIVYTSGGKIEKTSRAVEQDVTIPVSSDPDKVPVIQLPEIFTIIEIL